MSSENKRKHFRISISAPIRWQILTDNEVKILQNGEGFSLLRQNTLPSPIDDYLEKISPGSSEEPLFRSLQYINNKLDFIINQMSVRKSDNLPDPDTLTEISASGVKFSTQRQLEAGAYLRINLIMPGTFQYQLEFLAKIQRVHKQNDCFSVATKIIVIDDESQDSIIRVVFQKQRQDIRREKLSQEDSRAN
ncbi:MAG: PilZ domain-containing protein [Deltaproteobacteria bacterium]|nr:PilZ domain-containing protein [Deltaproteobacteria bacterium]